MSPDLSRRDALVALGAAGVATAGAGALVWQSLSGGDGPPSTDRERETIVAAAEALYPSEVSGIESFVETYVVGRIQGRPDYRDGVFAAARRLDEYAQAWYDDHFGALDRATRQQVLDEYGLATAEPDPGGNDVERTRYFLVNELLFAFYTSPTGASLVGLENPPGHPGGTSSYRRGGGEQDGPS